MRASASSVLHGPHGAVASQVETLLLLARERPRPDAPEDRDLPAGLVHGAVAVQALGERDRARGGLAPGGEPGFRLGAEAVELRLALGRGELDHLEPVLSVGDVGEGRGVGRAHDDVARIAQFSAGGEVCYKLRRWVLLPVVEPEAFGAGWEV